LVGIGRLKCEVETLVKTFDRHPVVPGKARRMRDAAIRAAAAWVVARGDERSSPAMSRSWIVPDPKEVLKPGNGR